MYNYGGQALSQDTRTDLRAAFKEKDYTGALQTLQGSEQGQQYLQKLQDGATQWQAKRIERFNESGRAETGATGPQARTFNFANPIDTTLSEEEQQ